jgi:hypothetical protein
MVAYVLIPKLAFEEHRDALLERAREDLHYGYLQYRGDEVVVAFAQEDNADFFRLYCVTTWGIRPKLELPN